MIRTIAISGYRSLRDVRLSLASLNVVTGANGVGKSSLYRAIRLLADIAQGRIIQSLAAEGGLHSTLWAGPEQFSRAMKQGRFPVQGTVRKAALSLASRATTTVTPSILACRRRRVRNSHAIPPSRQRTNGTARH
jgi:predicted ATPase